MKVDQPLPEAEGSMRAELYAALHSGSPGDVDFYVRACQGAGKILEYGCGAGRIALALAELGHRVTGVDRDPAFLALAEKRKAAREAELGWVLPVNFVLADMTTFRKRGLDRVIVPYSALWCLEGTESKRQCLVNARASLRRGGQLVLDVYDADVMADGDSDEDGPYSETPAALQDEFEELHRVSLAGVNYRVWERNTWDSAKRTMQVEYRLLAVAQRSTNGGEFARKAVGKKAAPRRGLASRRSLPSAIVSRGGGRGATAAASSGYQLTLRHSVLWRHELAELLDECGFEVDWGADEAAEATPFAEQVVVRAVRV